MYRYKVRKVLAFVFSLSIVCLNALPLGVSADSNSETTTSVTQSVDTTTKAVTEKTKDAEVTTTAKTTETSSTTEEKLLKQWKETYGDSLISYEDYSKLSDEEREEYYKKYKGQNIQENKKLRLTFSSLNCTDEGMGNVKLSVDGQEIQGAFDSYMAFSNVIVDQSKSISLGDTHEIKLTNLPDMVSYVEYNGKEYYNNGGTITITVKSDNTTSGIDSLFFDDLTLGSSEANIGDDENPVYYGISTDVEGTSNYPFDLKFHSDSNKMMVYVVDEDGNKLSGASVTATLSAKGTVDRLIGNEQHIKTNSSGYALLSLVDGMSREVESAWSLDYVIEYNGVSSMAKTKTVSYMADGMPTVYLTYVPTANTSSIYDDPSYQSEYDTAEIGQSDVLVNTSFSNVDGSFVELSGVSVTFTDSDGLAATYSLDDFDGLSISLPTNETYTVTYTSEDYSYFKIFGPSTFTPTEDEETFTVSLEAKYVLEIHKVVDGKEVAWNFINPLTGETISGTGIKKYAVANGVTYSIEDADTGEVYAVGVNADESGTGGTLLDLYTGETSVTSATDNVFAIPQTGDALTIALTSLGVIGAAGASYFVYNKKKKDKLDSSSEESDYDEI